MSIMMMMIERRKKFLYFHPARLMRIFDRIGCIETMLDEGLSSLTFVS